MIKPGTAASDAQSQHPEAEAQAPDPALRTKIKNVAIFTHGVPHGIALQPSEGRKYHKQFGLHTKHAHEKSNIGNFVEQVKGSLSSDVNVLLYACSTGRDVGTVASDEHTSMPEEGERAGEKSFADDLAENLQEAGLEGASVYSHLIAAHTTENPYARVYGADAGEGDGGVHFFDILYPSSFLDEEIVRLVPDLARRPEAQQQQIRQRMRAAMWDHYKDCLLKEHHRRNSKKSKSEDMVFGRQRYMTLEAFQDPTGIAAELHQDFAQRWLTQDRQEAIRGTVRQVAEKTEPATKEPERREPERSGPEQQ